MEWRYRREVEISRVGIHRGKEPDLNDKATAAVAISVQYENCTLNSNIRPTQLNNGSKHCSSALLQGHREVWS